MKHEGRGVARLGDSTSHGGRVISATGPAVLGIPAARQGDMTHCPQCKADFAITPDGAGARHLGLPCAYDGDLTACGARLVSSI
ncbi:hypothetical protein RD110_17410 [Rhodoferax koreense]|uniref:PAAR domain-containing protein n=1 Tax=Rhodoferax koreensis TaxID=1842727 RepID=A0A1P8JYC7_9BURK|nr:PAAR domain-containing protein [Rhodoferax koreense]APW38762.1 hypothetical protein RD110_17410 [Rhodoferax koreense]